ncbi:hypothetical protein MXB_2914, partial [Myxobolus squamalis]
EYQHDASEDPLWFSTAASPNQLKVVYESVGRTVWVGSLISLVQDSLGSFEDEGNISKREEVKEDNESPKHAEAGLLLIDKENFSSEDEDEYK